MANAKPLKPLPSGEQFTKEWDRLDKVARKRVRQCASRAEPAPNRREAALAAAMAVNQQRMWKWAWLVGPVVLALLRFPDGPQVMLLNFGLGLVVFGLMAKYFTWKARKAERVNREVMDGKRPSTGKGRG